VRDAAAALIACRERFEAMDFAGAAAACEQALKMNPALDAARLRLGWVRLELGDPDAAIEAGRSVLGRARNDRQRGEAIALIAAVLTVRHEDVQALELLAGAESQGLDGEIHDRLAILRDGAVSRDFVERVLPRYACWLKKGALEGAAFLLRRGVSVPEAFSRALSALPADTRTRLEEQGRAACPW
jgi:tetratricopeptide (TPR) repeat protein